MTRSIALPRLVLTRWRAGLIVVALASIGGTGCFTAVALTQASDDVSARMEEKRIERRIAQLTPQAQAGDAAAMTALAYFLMRRGDQQLNDPDVARELPLLERAADAGNVQAQAVLGVALAGERTFARVNHTLPRELQDRPRAIALLKKAATQACRINTDLEPRNAYDPLSDYIQPALQASILLREQKRMDESWLWFARSVVHCGPTEVPSMLSPLDQHSGVTWAERAVTVAPLYVLAGVPLHIGEVKAHMTPEAFAAAERAADDLRRRVAASEREYPAPRSRELR